MPRQPTKPESAQRDPLLGQRPESEHVDRETDAARAPDAEPDPQPDAEPDHERSTHPAQPIRIGERIFNVGMTGTGKSEAMLSAFANYRGQRLLIDVQDHMHFGPVALAEDPPPLETDRPEEIDWRHRTIRYVVRKPGDKSEMEKLHAAIFNRGNLFIACDEAEDVGPSQGVGAAFSVKKCLKQGRKRRITYCAASQRPFGVDRALTMQAQHALVFPMVDDDDLRVMARRLGMTVEQLKHTLDGLGPHEYLRHTVGQREVLHMPALPPTAIAFTRGHVVNPQFTARG